MAQCLSSRGASGRNPIFLRLGAWSRVWRGRPWGPCNWVRAGELFSWLSFWLIASCAAAVAEGLDVLLASWAGLGSGALRGSLRLRGHDTVVAAWGLLEARVTGGSRAVASAGPGTTGHELGADITAADVSHSASGPRSTGWRRLRHCCNPRVASYAVQPPRRTRHSIRIGCVVS